MPEHGTDLETGGVLDVRRSSRTVRRSKLWHCRSLAGLITSMALATFFNSIAAAEELDITLWAVVNSGFGGVPISAPRGVAIDVRRSEVLVANTGKHRIEVYDMKGRPKGYYVHRVDTPDGSLVESQPSDLAVDQSGHLLVVDLLATYVDVLDFRGRSVGRLELPPPDNNRALGNGPGSVMVRKDGTILVATRGEDGRIYRFGPDLKRLGVWGIPGSGEGHFSRIKAMAETPDGKLVVACQGTDLAVQVFDAAGQYQFGFGRHEVGPGNFSFPSGVTVTADGRIWTSDEIRQVIQVFDDRGTYVGLWGGGGLRPGEFQYPSALAGDGDSRLAVVERVGNRLQLLSAR